MELGAAELLTLRHAVESKSLVYVFKDTSILRVEVGITEHIYDYWLRLTS